MVRTVKEEPRGGGKRGVCNGPAGARVGRLPRGGGLCGGTRSSFKELKKIHVARAEGEVGSRGTAVACRSGQVLDVQPKLD